MTLPAENDKPVKDQLKDFLREDHNKVKFYSAVAILGTLIFLLIAFTLPIKKKEIATRYKKPPSQAAELVFKYKEKFVGAVDGQGQNNLNYQVCTKDGNCSDAIWNQSKGAYAKSDDPQFKISKDSIVPGVNNNASIKYTSINSGTAKLEGSVKRLYKQIATPPPTPSPSATSSTSQALGEATQSAAVSQIPYIFKIRKDGKDTLREFKLKSANEFFFYPDDFGDISVTPNTTLEFTIDSNGDAIAAEVELNFTIKFTSPVVAERPQVSLQQLERVGVAMSESIEVKVWMLQYIPPNGVDPSRAVNDPIAFTKNTLLPAMTEGSKYHGYSNPTVRPSLQYTLNDQDIHTENSPPPKARYSNNYDYLELFRKYDLCDYATRNNIKTVILWLDGDGLYNAGGYESVTTGKYDRVIGDNNRSTGFTMLPGLCDKRIVIYGFNYQRGLPEALESYSHHLEFILGQVRPEYNLWSGSNTFNLSPYPASLRTQHCGTAHDAPNARYEYDRSNPVWTAPHAIDATKYPNPNNGRVTTDCRNWKPDSSGEKETIDCSAWGCSADKYLIWWMQNMPGMGNELIGRNRVKIPNWWVYIGDPEKCLNNPSECSPDSGRALEITIDTSAYPKACTIGETLFDLQPTGDVFHDHLNTRGSPLRRYVPASPGQTVRYKLEILNYDSEGCNPTTFRVNGWFLDSFSGWTVHLPNDTITVNSGGLVNELNGQGSNRGDVYVDITSPSNADPGVYPFIVRVRDIVETHGLKHSGTLNPVYVVFTGLIDKTYRLSNGWNSIGLSIRPLSGNLINLNDPYGVRHSLSVGQFLTLTQGKCTEVKVKNTNPDGEVVLSSNDRFESGRGYLVNCPQIPQDSSISVSLKGPKSTIPKVLGGSQFVAIPALSVGSTKSAEQFLQELSQASSLYCNKIWNFVDGDWARDPYIKGSNRNNFQLDDAKGYKVYCGFSFTPLKTSAGSQVTITGKGFGTTKGQVFFSNDIEARVDSWNDTNIVAIVPSTATTGKIKLKLNNGLVLESPQEFNVFTCSACSADISGGPDGSKDNKVNILDFGFYASCRDKPVTEKVGTKECRIADINGDGVINDSDFNCIQQAFNQSCPSIESIEPAQAREGTEVRIKGSGFGYSQGKVFFGDKEAIVLPNGWAFNEIKVTVPQGAISAKIKVQTSPLSANNSAETPATFNVVVPVSTPTQPAVTTQPSLRTQAITEPTQTPTTSPTITPRSTTAPRPASTPRPAPLRVSCSVSPNTANVNQNVRWTARASGGTGGYTYTWQGLFPIKDKTGQEVNISYPNPGRMSAFVRVTSGTQTKTESCSNYVYVNYPRTNIINRFRNFIRR